MREPGPPSPERVRWVPARRRYAPSVRDDDYEWRNQAFHHLVEQAGTGPTVGWS
jgi:hypothetical protein